MTGRTADPIDEFRTPRPIAGWRVVLTAFCMALYAWGLGFYGLSLYVHHLGDTPGRSAALLSVMTTVYFLAGAAAIGWVERAALRYGRRPVTIAGVLLMAAGVAALPRAQHVAVLLVAYLAMAFGWAATAGTAVSRVIGQWFDRRRGLALNLALTGASASGFVLVPMLAWGIGRFGAADGLAWVAAGAAAVLLLLVTRLPEPERAAARDGAATDATTASATASPRGEPLATVTALFALAWIAQVAFLSQQVPLLVPAIGAAQAALAVGVTTAASLAGRLLLAPLIDRIDHRRATASSCAIQAAGMALLIASDAPAAVLAGCLLFGLSVGNLITLPAIFAQREFAAARYGAVVDRVWSVGQFAFAFAPAGAGALLVAGGGPHAVFGACAALQLAAAALCFTRRPA